MHMKSLPRNVLKLKEIVEKFKMCFDDSELPHKLGTRPLQACGTRFVALKVSSLSRIIDWFGSYLSHLTSLSEDCSFKSVGRQKLKGCILRSKILLGCAFFHGMLKSVGNVCKILQEDELCVVRRFEAFVKTGAYEPPKEHETRCHHNPNYITSFENKLDTTRANVGIYSMCSIK